MRISICLIILLLTGFFLSCERNIGDRIKEVEKDLYSKEEISGIVYLNDTFMDAPTVVAPEATIYVSTTTSAATYLYSTKADKAGKFTFTHRPQNDNFYLIGQFKNKDSILFEKAILFTEFLKDRTLLLDPQYPKGKIKITAVDAVSQPLFEADVYLFINQAQAESIDDSTPKGNIRKATTNEKGTAFFYNLEKGTYFIAGKKDNLIARPMSVTVSEDNVKSFTITQAQPTSLTLSAPAQLTVIVKDADVNPIYGASVHVFSSISQANSLTTSSPTSITYSTTDKNGVAKISGLASNTTYYVDAKATFVVTGTTVTKTNIGGPKPATISQPVSLTL